MASPKSQNRKRKRTIGHLEAIDRSYYIFSEGVQTEPHYFSGFKAAIESNPMYQNMVHVEVEGLGCETLRVIYGAEDYVKTNRIRNAEIWCVYDKDSFPADHFNGVAQYADKLNKGQSNVTYHVAWSNQCIEYWFLLHFEWYDSDNDRTCYRRFLSSKFAEHGISKYKKNDDEIFNILLEHGDPKKAIRFAERRLKECEGCTDANSAPATKVHLLVKELAKYLPDKMRQKFI